MNVKTFLNLIGDRPLSSIRPEGVQVTEIINKYSEQRLDVSELTGTTALEVIDALDPQDRDEILLTELNDGLDLVQYRRELQSLLETKDSSGKRLRPVLAFGMATLMAIGSLALSFAIVWVAYNENQLPPWELCLIAMGGPVMVVWQYNGVLTQERKDFLAAAIGRTPQAGIIGGLLGRMGSGPIQRRSSDTPGYGNEYDEPRPRKRNSGAHGGPPAV